MEDRHIIPMSDCIHGHAYRIQSRNLVVGVYKESDHGFVGIREKFDSRYLFTEYHHDTGAPFGTASPFRDLGECPIDDLAEGHSDGKHYVTNKPLFDWLEAKEAEVAEPCAQCGQPFYPVPWADPYCFRRDCWDSRCQPCPTCAKPVLDSDGTQTCERCTDPLAYDLMLIRAKERLDAERKKS